jgi:NAD(P)H-dependent flavin oxidoreductase YrpB (nitropropane dioxygenase family)
VRDGLTMRKQKDLTWSQVIMAANTPMLLKAGLVEGNTHAGVLAAGQVTGIIEDLPTVADLIDRIIGEAVARIDALTELRTAGTTTPTT